MSENSQAPVERGTVSNSISQAAVSLDTGHQLADAYDLSQPRVISVTSDMSITNW